MKTMILFDLDGTLWDSSDEVAQAWNEAFADAWISFQPKGRQPRLNAEDVKRVMGKTMNEIARIFLPEEPPELQNLIFRQCESHENDYLLQHGGTLFPDVEETLKRLLEQGYLLAIVSNCQKDYVKTFLLSMNMEAYFCDYEEWGRTGKTKGENIRIVMERNRVKEAVYVGDTQKDADSAKEAGISFLWASYGFGNVRDFREKLTRFRDLPEVMEQIKGRINPVP